MSMRGEVAIAISALLMSTVSIFVRNINADAITVTFLRFSTAFLFISIFMLIIQQKPMIKEFKPIILLSIFNVSTVICYISAIQSLEVATAALLLYMAPIYVLPIAYVSGERIELKTWIALPLGILGLYLMLSPYATISIGLILGVLSGVSYALVFYTSKIARRKHNPFEINFYTLMFGSLVLLPYFILNPIKDNIFWIFGLGLIPTAIPFVLFTYGIKYVRVQVAPILALLEPLSATIIGYIVFKEVLTFKQIIGAILILASTFIAWSEREKL